MASGALTKHGYPRGYRFVPDHLEVVELLADRLRGRPLPPPVAATFHDIRILDHHPQQLYEQYKAFQEAGCIYFFSPQEYPPPARAPVTGKTRRPARTAHGGSWKPSGGAKLLKNGADVIVGKMVTMVFYDKRHIKTNWGLREFTVRVGPNKFSDLAVYRLYRVKSGAAKGGGNQQQQQQEEEANVAHHQHHVPVADHHAPSTSAAAAPPSYAAGSSSATDQALAFGASASHQEQKQPIIGIDQTQLYHNQYAFAATTAMPGQPTWPPPPAAANSPDDTKPPPVPVAGYLQFAAGSPEQVTTAPPAPVNNPPGEQQPPAAASTAAMSPPHAPLVAGCDETMDDAPSQPPQLALPALDEDYLSAMLNEGPEGPVDGGILDYNSFFQFDGGDILFTMDDLTGTDHTSSGDGSNLAVGGGEQDVL